MELSADWPTYELTYGVQGDRLIRLLYGRAGFRNWYPSILSIYLAKVQVDLQRHLRESIDTRSRDRFQLKALAETTLYVPEHVMIKFGAFTGDESERHDPAKLFKGYPYDWKVVNAEELEAVLAAADAPVHVFDYVKASSEKLVSVYRSDGQMPLRAHDFRSWNVRPKDIRNIH